MSENRFTKKHYLDAIDKDAFDTKKRSTFRHSLTTNEMLKQAAEMCDEIEELELKISILEQEIKNND